MLYKSNYSKLPQLPLHHFEYVLNVSFCRNYYIDIVLRSIGVTQFLLSFHYYCISSVNFNQIQSLWIEISEIPYVFLKHLFLFFLLLHYGRGYCSLANRFLFKGNEFSYRKSWRLLVYFSSWINLILLYLYGLVEHACSY